MKVLSRWLLALAICGGTTGLLLASTQTTSRQLTDLEKKLLRGGVTCNESVPGPKKCSDCIGPIPSSGLYQRCFFTTGERICKLWSGSGPFVPECINNPDVACGGQGTTFVASNCTGYSGGYFNCQRTVSFTTPSMANIGANSCP